jgi:hypothetical protein
MKFSAVRKSEQAMPYGLDLVIHSPDGAVGDAGLGPAQKPIEVPSQHAYECLEGSSREHMAERIHFSRWSLARLGLQVKPACFPAPDSFDAIIEVLDDGGPISLVENGFSAFGTGTLRLPCPGKFYFALAAALASRTSFIAARATATNMIKSTRPYVYHRPPRLDICFSIKAPRGLLVAIEFETL